MSQEQAQSLIDFEAKRMQDQTSQLAETWHVGLGNHPEVLRAFSKAGRAISDDEIESGKGPAVAPKSAAELIYNNTK